MIRNKTWQVMSCFFILCVASVYGATLQENWNDFLHYTAVGRIDLAKGHAQLVLDSNPDPVELLKISEQNPQAYGILLRVYNNSAELKDVASKLLDIIEKGRFELRTNPEIIKQEIARLSTTERGRIKAEQRLRNAGEYAVPFLLDAISDPARKKELPAITVALSKMDRDAIRPLVASLEMSDHATKIEVVRALGKIKYPQSLAYLKYIYETASAQDLKEQALNAIKSIDPNALSVSSAKLFYDLAKDYYYHYDSVAPRSDFTFANIWFWDTQENRLKREKVSKKYFFELMSMRSCEWALRSDENTSEAISLWIASFFKVEETNVAMPKYFGQGHADAMTYATTAGPEYLQAALAMAIKDQDDYVVLNLVEALAVNAGESSLLYMFGTTQPLVDALTYKSLSVRYSAAIAIGSVGPTVKFVGDRKVVDNLSDAIVRVGSAELGEQSSLSYAQRAMDVLVDLAISNNDIVDVTQAKESLVKVLKSDNADLAIKASKVLAFIDAPEAQRAIVKIAIDESYDTNLRLSVFDSLTVSIKKFGNMLSTEQVDTLYEMSASRELDAKIRSSAAGAYGSLNLPSKKVKTLILDQAKK